jgi:uroporphyrin-III C-methyltransferase
MISSSGYPAPQPGVSLLLSFRAVEKRIVIYGSASLAASRAFAALEAGASVTIVARGGIGSACDELQWRYRNGQLEILGEESVGKRDAIMSPSPASLVCVTDTLLLSSPRRENADVEAIVKLCREERIPLNVADRPDLSDVSFLTTHRFGASPLQVGVTTNGRGCRLASRIKRDLVAKLDKASGEAVSRVGEMRDLAKQEIPNASPEDDEEESTPNRPVPVRVMAEAEESPAERTRRRMKWVAQVSEYWPIDRLARLNREEMTGVLNGQHVTTSSPPPSALTSATTTTPVTLPSHHSLDIPPIPGTIYLVGSGPGHPSLLTRAAYTLLTERAQLVLSDKLVPASVLALIPPHVPVTIARKFPGNADNAQMEMMDAAIEAARKGLCVVRVRFLLLIPLSLYVRLRY